MAFTGASLRRVSSGARRSKNRHENCAGSGDVVQRKRQQCPVGGKAVLARRLIQRSHDDENDQSRGRLSQALVDTDPLCKHRAGYQWLQKWHGRFLGLGFAGIEANAKGAQPGTKMLNLSA